MNGANDAPSVLDRLRAGVLRFQTQTFAPQAEAYRRAAATAQQPHTLFITFADSRIDVEKLISAGIGEVFITRNIGNMVPSYSHPLEGVAAVIEYAVVALKVQHIVVCGHSECGAMKGLLHPSATASLPAVRSWLRHAPEEMRRPDVPGQAPLRELTERNVLLQLDHLKTHPAVIDALAVGQLSLSGWVYEIGSGEVRIAEDGTRVFTPVSAPAGRKSAAI